jgi:hypothetical protein
LATTQQIRVEDDAEYAKEEHLEQALAELGIDTTKTDLPEADTGVGDL